MQTGRSQSFRQTSGDDRPLDREATFSVQRIREARSSSRKLLTNLQKLKSSLARPLIERMETASLDSALATLEQSNVRDARQKAASEVRQLRYLFTQTGFGDQLTVPADFDSRIESALSRGADSTKTADVVIKVG
jgi:hypothetical protein